MIIDSHAHYAHRSFGGEFTYLAPGADGWQLQQGDLDRLLDRLEEAGIEASIEPGIAPEGWDGILALAKARPGRVIPALGVHPTRVCQAKFRDLSRLKKEEYAAIGETGLDFHHPRPQQHRLRQYCFFLAQLWLARRLKKPVILHIRQAHSQALAILERWPVRHGGVVHCFHAGRAEAERYLKLGLHLGIGGSLLQEGSEALAEAVSHAPLDRLLLETDAPYILPPCPGIPRKQRRRARNCSLILPQVAEAIAGCQGVSAEEVCRVTAQNARRLFRL